VICETNDGRKYRAGTPRDTEIRDDAVRFLAEASAANTNTLPLRPNEPLPPQGTLGFRIQNYGMRQFGDLYNSRQVLALTAFCKAIRNTEEMVESEVIPLLLALAVGRVQDLNSSLATWADTVVGANRAQNRVSMVWDYAEAVSIAEAGGSWTNQVDWVVRVVEHVESTSLPVSGTASLSPAQSQPLPDEAANAVITDPPYYDAFAYSDLSDLFLVWLKRAVSDPKGRFNLESPQSTSPKGKEIVVNPAAEKDGRGPKDHNWFSEQMCNALADARRVTQPSGLSVIVFAHKGTQSWESLLDGIVRAGWTLTASWPIDTERPSRQRAQDSAALTSSVHLVARPRENPDGSLREEVGEWRDVLSELPPRIHEWMPRLAAEGVVGADAIFACLGPALEIFSRYSRVEKASGEAVPLREYLEQVWAAVSTEALSMIFKDADAAGLEPDARLTAMWLWTLGANTGDSNGKGKSSDDKVTASTGYTLEFDAARKIAQGLGIHLEQSESIIEVKGDKARMLPVSERTRHLFGKDEADAKTARGRKKKKTEQQRSLFEELHALESEPDVETVAGELKPQAGETVLDRVHQSMILFASGRGEALRRFLVEDGAGNDARFWKLAQSLSALYPKDTDEKRWVDGVLARKKGLGL
jgi:putative DNA methylase